MPTIGVLTLSDRSAAGVYEDRSGAVAQELLREGIPGAEIARYAVIPDGLALIVTTGGTGLAPRDVTPDATLAVLTYQVPGLAEAMRAASLAATPLAMLSR